jgi:prepilin-type processing-associated H-X9-DG protein
LAEINYRLPASVERSPPTGIVKTDLQNKRLYAYGSEHAGGCNIAFADGSVRFVSDALSMDVLHSLSTREGAELDSEY